MFFVLDYMSIRWRTHQYVQNSFYEHQSHCAVVLVSAEAFAGKMMLLHAFAICLLLHHYCRQTIRKEGLVGWLVLSSKYSFRFKKCCWIIQHKCTTGNHHLIGSFCEFITSSMEALDYPTTPGQGRTSDLIGTWISLIGPSHGVISMGTSHIFKVRCSSPPCRFFAKTFDFPLHNSLFSWLVMDEQVMFIWYSHVYVHGTHVFLLIYL